LGDIQCTKCGEPWEFYYVQHEFTEEERRKFYDYRGCPSCNWGKDVEEEKSMEEQRLQRLMDMDASTDLDPLAFL